MIIIILTHNEIDNFKQKNHRNQLILILYVIPIYYNNN